LDTLLMYWVTPAKYLSLRGWLERAPWSKRKICCGYCWFEWQGGSFLSQIND